MMSQHDIDRARIAALEAENDTLRERVRVIERDFLNAEWLAPLELGLTMTQTRILACLAGRADPSTKAQLMHALYSGRIDDEPEIKIVDVIVCHLRRKLKPYGIAIETRWGVGYFMSKEARDRLNAMRQDVAA